jgi:hypothetical protein
MSCQIQTLRDDPVIVLGMHHSGTSILAEVLHRYGVFMQANMHHVESKFFVINVNEQLIMGNGASWARDPIMPVDEVMAKLEQVRRRIERKAYTKYLEAGYDGHSRWGFKDPRTCVTLPLYLKIFPKAQLVHIIRDENDVALSLSASNKKGVGVNPDLSSWKSLHRQYTARAREYGARHKEYYEFQYEDFCKQPVTIMKSVFAFLALDFAEDTRQFLEKNIYTHRIHLSQKSELARPATMRAV